jgi:hypothetical protein
MHKDLVTSERGGPSPYRAVEPWLLLLLLLLLLLFEAHTDPLILFISLEKYRKIIIHCMCM